MQFMEHPPQGKFGLGRVSLTIGLVILAYFVGSLFLFLDVFLNFQDHDYVIITMTDFADVMGKNRLFIWMLFPFVLVFATLIFATKYIHQIPIKSIFTARDRFDWKKVFFSFLLWGFLCILITLLDLFYHGNFTLTFEWSKFIPLFILSILLLPIQTTCEELLFRSYLLKGLKRKLGSSIGAILISGIMFGLIHAGNPEIARIGYHLLIYYALIGIFLGYLVTLDNGLELSIGFHAANNLVIALLVTTNWQAFQTDAVFTDYNNPGNAWWTILLGLLMLLLFFFLLRWKYKWKISR